MNANLHPKTQKVLDILQAKNRRRPTMQEIADRLGMKRLEVINQVIQLRRLGYIKTQKPLSWSTAPLSKPFKPEPRQPAPFPDYALLERRKTPLSAVRDLLELEDFEGSIWDPACGVGEMSDLLKAKFKQRFRATDIATGDDFLISKQRADAIITHPPIRLSKEFATKALELANKKAALWLGLHSLGEARKLTNHGMSLKAVHIVRLKEPRRSILAGPRPPIDLPTMAWFVWEKGHEGSARLNWM